VVVAEFTLTLTINGQQYQVSGSSWYGPASIAALPPTKPAFDISGSPVSKEVTDLSAGFIIRAN
jgi:hypothetical protein